MPDAERTTAGPGGPPLLVLLHGLGGTAAVWDRWTDVLRDSWPGPWLALDLPGHGHAPTLRRYSFGSMAAHSAEMLPPGRPVVVLGHSLGGVVALALSSGWFGVRVTGVVGLGIKVAWAPDELSRAAGLSARPVDWFHDRSGAAARWLKVSGLAGLPGVDDAVVASGLREQDGGWRLALDPGAYGVGAPDMTGLLAASKADVVLARGEHDPMVTDDQLADLPVATAVLPGLGHNAHVEDPAAVAGLLQPWTP